MLTGKTATMRRVKFPIEPLPPSLSAKGSMAGVDVEPGNYVAVEIVHSIGGNLVGRGLARTSTQEFVKSYGRVVPLEDDSHVNSVAQAAGQ